MPQNVHLNVLLVLHPKCQTKLQFRTFNFFIEFKESVMVGEKSLDFIRWSTQRQLRHYTQASGVWGNKLTVPPQLSVPTHLSANLLY